MRTKGSRRVSCDLEDSVRLPGTLTSSLLAMRETVTGKPTRRPLCPGLHAPTAQNPALLR